MVAHKHRPGKAAPGQPLREVREGGAQPLDFSTSTMWRCLHRPYGGNDCCARTNP